MKPKLAILGAGPTGLEAALAAVERGLPFTLYEAGIEVGAHLRQWGHVQLFSSWELNVSPRMRQALATIDQKPPQGDDFPTGGEMVEHVFAPLGRLPRIAEHLRLATRVEAISKEGLLKHEEIGTGRRAEHPFRLLLSNGKGEERVEHADAVLDCTGNYGSPNSLGDGGIAAPGEGQVEEHITRQIPDVQSDADAWGGRRILLVGAGHSAQTAAIDLAQLAQNHPGTQVFWALRRPSPPSAYWEILKDDPLPERSRLASRAQQLLNDSSSGIQPLLGVVVEALTPTETGVRVSLRAVAHGSDSGQLRELEVDRILSLTGFVGDHQMYRQLQVHECYATSGPMKLAAALLGESSSDCLAQTTHGSDTLVNPEPNFFILGSKSYGRNTTFLMRVGWQQVDEVFSLLG